LTSPADSPRPLTVLTLAYAVGVAAGCLLQPQPALPLVLGLAAVAVAALPPPLVSLTQGGRTRFPASGGVIATHRLPPGWGWLLFVVLAALGAGALMASLAWRRLDPGPARSESARWVTAEGRIVSEPRPTETGFSFYLAATSAGPGRRDGETFYVLLRCGPTGGTAATGPAAGSAAGAPSGLSPGDRVRVSGFLSRPRPPSNPGEFDFPLYLAVRGVRYTLSVGEGRLAVPEVPGGRATGRGPVQVFVGACRAARENLTAVMDRSLPPAQAALLSGLLFGDTSRLPDDVARDFRRCGVFHILAVSGSNVAFVAGGFWLVSRPLLRSLGLRGRRLDRVLWPATGLALAAYAVMTGLGPSVVRATLMAEAGLVYLWLGRRRAVTGPLCLAALAVLLPRPLVLLDVGFQLSYAATLGILFIYPSLRRALEPAVLSRLHRWVRPAAEAALVSVAAQAAVTPVLARHFGEISLVGLVANAAVVPLSGVAVTTGLAAGVTGLAGPLGGPIAAVFFTITSLLLRTLTGLGRFFASLPGASIVVGCPGVWVVALYYLALAWVVRGAGRGRGRRRILLTLVVSGSLVVGSLATGAAAYALPGLVGQPPVEVTFLAVGQGDAAFIVLPGGRTMLVDGGPPGAGERLIGPFLRHRGIGRVDWIVATHLHDDHVGGLVELLRDPSITVGELVVGDGAPARAREERPGAGDPPEGGSTDGETSKEREAPPPAAALFDAAGEAGVPVREVSRGARLGAFITVLWPPDGRDRSSGEGEREGLSGKGATGSGETGVRSASAAENDESLVLLLQCGSEYCSGRGRPASASGAYPSGGASLLLVGDLESTGEAALLALHRTDPSGRAGPAGSGDETVPAGAGGPGLLDADILKVGHHGSAYSTGQAFLRAVSPDVAVISVGENSFGHPSPRTVERLKGVGAAVFNTLEDGAVILRVGGRAGRVVTVETFLSRRRLRLTAAGPGGATVERAEAVGSAEGSGGVGFSAVREESSCAARRPRWPAWREKTPAGWPTSLSSTAPRPTTTKGSSEPFAGTSLTRSWRPSTSPPSRTRGPPSTPSAAPC